MGTVAVTSTTFDLNSDESQSIAISGYPVKTKDPLTTGVNES